ncbi:cytochrome c [Alisedimentitalea sp. MJ-SS2]|uniref:c-type cytochrome n=1 Tax=Aliisedimentitalea sp. MJ-SS2 TaxID=3049795 RepID=UPI002906C523|nr:cytochrome c [Alisedimentitalea sp. MJ-SS2]MDU8927188.1 cytochrome c [Alisedimentitalea sp. MJ-SS2]
MARTRHNTLNQLPPPSTVGASSWRPLSWWAAAAFLTLILSLAPFLPVSAMADQPDAKALQRLVHQDCGSCHGLRLKGGLGPDLRVESIEHYDVEGLRMVILDGIEGTAMPPWRPLMSEEEATWIANYLLKGDYE